MRLRIALVLALAFTPRVGLASAIIVTASDEGAMDYGLLWAVDIGHESFSSVDVSIDGGAWRSFGGRSTSYVGVSGPLLSLTLTRDAGGAVIESRYVYDGGLFDMSFDLEDPVTGNVTTGDFMAPIVGPMIVTVHESDCELCDSAEVSYRLGPGLFDASIARLLGVRRHTKGGFVEDPYLTFGTGDYTSLERRLDEGGAMVRIDVPEPASLLLLGAAGVALVARRHSAKR